jgi:hypothetical protein
MGDVHLNVTSRGVLVAVLFCSGKARSIQYSECVSVALGIQHEMRMRLVPSCVASLAVSYYSTLSHKLYDLQKKNLQRIKSVF